MAQENPQVRRSLDEVEKAYWNPGPSPLDAPLTPCLHNAAGHPHV